MRKKPNTKRGSKMSLKPMAFCQIHAKEPGSMPAKNWITVLPRIRTRTFRTTTTLALTTWMRLRFLRPFLATAQACITPFTIILALEITCTEELLSNSAENFCEIAWIDKP